MPETIPEAIVVVTEAFEGVAVDRWARLIAETVALAPRRLIVDLRASPVLDAAAIAVLLRAHRTMMHTGGRLTLRGPAHRVRRILRLARLDHVFDTEDADPAEAMNT
ncbi:STAS domain-containing protein [Actinoplanes sp. ATCC 53533]|uniref:STAS domain-containing protein n=1 Tax=Actinoplanes sp. ATCC 53533 TaxID=1288362 RepID=UPI0013154B5F|nr:STAS domain-containing protein [Actinoplanes sp. ATCC 53533]